MRILVTGNNGDKGMEKITGISGVLDMSENGVKVIYERGRK